GGDVGNLLELQRAFQADREADVAPEVEEERLVEMPLRDLLDRMITVEELLHPRRQLVCLVHDELDLVCRQRLASLRHLERDQEEERHLRGEGLRRGARGLD